MFSIIIIVIISLYANEIQNKECGHDALSNVNSWRFNSYSYLSNIGSNSRNQIRCLHEGEHHELCDADYFWPEYIECSCVTSKCKLYSRQDKSEIIASDILREWECKSNSVYSSDSVIKCEKVIIDKNTKKKTIKKIDFDEVDACDVHMGDCFVVFDPVDSYNFMLNGLYISMLIIFMIAILLFIIVISNNPLTCLYKLYNDKNNKRKF